MQELKTNYKAEKRKLKAEYKMKKSALKASAGLDSATEDKAPQRSILEEVGNAITHGLGTVFGFVAFGLMLARSEGKIEILATSIYSFGLIVMFTASCLYHSFKGGSRVKRLFRRFDYCSIYLLIGATFAPLLLIERGGVFGNTFFLIQWLTIIAGMTLAAIFGPNKLRPLHFTMYFIIGWSGLMLLPQMIASNLPLALYILGGGVVYSLGIIPFLMKKSAAHFIWHFFVLAGAVVQWLGIYIYIYLA